LTEVLTKPKQMSNHRLEVEYRSLLLHSRYVSLGAVTTTVAERAAGLRSRWSIRTPDALQIATGIEAGCQVFVTNDHRLRRVTDIRVLVLDDINL
jgi:predicted nucleic acid-binding protein